MSIVTTIRLDHEPFATDTYMLAILGHFSGDTNSWCKMTNFEHATRNTLLWRVPGQAEASKGRNHRLVEMVDFFPTAIELMGLPKIAPCAGVDQPPAVLCLQGESYADEFIPAPALQAPSPPKEPKLYAFSQWPYPIIESPGEKRFRMGYTVRGAGGYRLTQYVLYNRTSFRGDWTEEPTHDDLELYDYNTDPHETTNQAANPTYSGVVKELRAVLKEQYNPRS